MKKYHTFLSLCLKNSTLTSPCTATSVKTGTLKLRAPRLMSYSMDVCNFFTFKADSPTLLHSDITNCTPKIKSRIIIHQLQIHSLF